VSGAAAAFLFALGVLISGAVQVMLKRNAARPYTGVRIILNGVFILSNLIYFAVFAGSVLLMRYLSLTAATLLNALSYLFVPVLSRAFLKEHISKRTVAGIGLIILGLIVYASGSAL